MPKRFMSAAVMAAIVALAAGPAIASARPRTVRTLITIQQTIRHGLEWDVLDNDYGHLGRATEVSNSAGTTWKFRFILARGSIRTTWHFTKHGRSLSLSRAPIVGGSGIYKRATGYATVRGVTPAGRLTRSLTGAQYILVVFHLA